MGHVAHIPLGESDTAHVVTHKLPSIAQPAIEVVKLRMQVLQREGVQTSHDDQRQPLANHAVGDADAVRGSAEANMRLRHRSSPQRT